MRILARLNVTSKYEQKAKIDAARVQRKFLTPDKIVEKINGKKHKVEHELTESESTTKTAVRKIILKREKEKVFYLTAKPPTMHVKNVKIVDVNNNITTIQKRKIKKVYAYVVPNHGKYGIKM